MFGTRYVIFRDLDVKARGGCTSGHSDDVAKIKYYLILATSSECALPNPPLQPSKRLPKKTGCNRLPTGLLVLGQKAWTETVGSRISKNRQPKSGCNRCRSGPVAVFLASPQPDFKTLRTVVERFGLLNCKPVATPLPAGYSPVKHTAECTAKDRTLYQQIIGSLLYLALGTRPDIAFAVILMSQFCVNPSPDHISRALYIVKYIAHTLDTRITYTRNGQGFIAFSDADWATDRETRVSVTGYALTLAGGAVCWVSRKQKTVALSSTEAEYMAMSDTSRQIMWITNLYIEIGLPQGSIDLLCDNQGAIFSASNPVTQHKSKHIAICYHYIRERVENKDINLYYIPTNQQVADLMTKNLDKNKIKFFLNELGITINTTPLSTAKTHISKWHCYLSTEGLNSVEANYLMGRIKKEEFILRMLDPKIDKSDFAGDSRGLYTKAHRDRIMKTYEKYR